MKRIAAGSVVLSLVFFGAGAKRLHIPRGHANDKPKTLADQQRENEARQQKMEKKAEAKQPPPAPVVVPTTSPSVALAKAQADLTRVERRLWAGFEKGEDYVKAAGALKEAQVGYEKAYQGVTTKLGDNPEYAAAVRGQKEAEAELAAAKAGAGGDSAAVAAKVMDARKAVHKIEAEAAEKDDGVKAARAKVAEAKGVVDGLRKGFEETIKADPDYVAAHKAVDDARAKT